MPNRSSETFLETGKIWRCLVFDLRRIWRAPKPEWNTFSTRNQMHSSSCLCCVVATSSAAPLPDCDSQPVVREGQDISDICPLPSSTSLSGNYTGSSLSTSCPTAGCASRLFSTTCPTGWGAESKGLLTWTVDTSRAIWKTEFGGNLQWWRWGDWAGDYPRAPGGSLAREAQELYGLDKKIWNRWSKGLKFNFVVSRPQVSLCNQLLWLKLLTSMIF